MSAENLRKFSEVQTNVALTLTKQVISTEAKRKNFVFSPLSIHVILGLTAAGSDGPAHEELLDYLKSKSSDEFNSCMSQLVAVVFADGSGLGGPCLSVANGMWVDQRFMLDPKFKEMAQNVYNAVVDRVDFRNKTEEVIAKVNNWANEKTNGLIREMLSLNDVESIKLMHLTTGNAIYFKGAWGIPFDKEHTRDNKFFLLDGSSVYVSYMRSYQDQFISAFDGFKVLKLLYENGEDKRLFSMCIYLPDSRDGLEALVEKATSEPGFIERHLPQKSVAVGEFRIPKFKMCFDFVANEVLKELGNVSMFTCGITKIAGEDDVCVSRIIHKAFIEINEAGTEAAAVTLEDDVCFCLFAPETIDFVAEHPFLFVIREETMGTVLFVGQVCNPLVEE